MSRAKEGGEYVTWLKVKGGNLSQRQCLISAGVESGYPVLLIGYLSDSHIQRLSNRVSHGGLHRGFISGFHHN